MKTLIPLAVALCISLNPSVGNAQERNIWDESIEPASTTAEPMRRQLWASFSTPMMGGSWASVLPLANRAVQLCPNDNELRFLRGRILYRLDRWAEAAADLNAVIESAPEGPFAAEAAFEMGVALTRLERFEEASAAYYLFLRESPWPVSRSIALTNLAETLMARDLLDDALDNFRAAVAVEPRYTLGYFGLAVALDRAGEHAAALEAMLHGLSSGRGIAELSNPSVFYVPDWEVHYYLALAHEALGQPFAALEEWQLFLDGGGDGGPYAARVRDHVRRLEALE